MTNAARLRAMGEERFTKVTNDILRGVPFSQIVRMIKGDWGLFPDVAEMTLNKQIRRFATSLTNVDLGSKTAITKLENIDAKFLGESRIDVVQQLATLNGIY